MRARALFAVLALSLPAAVAHATLIEALDLRELVRGSDHVVVATVVRSEARYDHLDRIVTDTTLRVDERMYGPAAAGSTVVVRSLGGALGEVGLHVEGEPTFSPGERIVLFGRMHAQDRVLRAVGMSQGVLPMRREGGAEVVMPGGGGLALVQRGSDGRLRPAPGALIAPESADEVLARIRDLVLEIHGAR
jgi:hypothetical protein